MAARRDAPGDRFRLLATWGASLLAGCVFGYIIAQLAGWGWGAGILFGSVTFVATGWILTRAVASDLPPPDALKAPTVPQRAAGSVDPSATSVPGTDDTVAGKLGKDADHAGGPLSQSAAGVSEVVSPAARAARGPQPAAARTAEVLGTGPNLRVREAARAAAEAASGLMGDPVLAAAAAERARPAGIAGPREGGADED